MYDFEENHRIQLTEVVDESLDPSLFEVPSDFEMMSIMPGG